MEGNLAGKILPDCMQFQKNIITFCALNISLGPDLFLKMRGSQADVGLSEGVVRTSSQNIRWLALASRTIFIDNFPFD